MAGTRGRTFAKSRKIRGGPSSAPIMGSGSGPSATIAITESLPRAATLTARRDNSVGGWAAEDAGDDSSTRTVALDESNAETERVTSRKAIAEWRAESSDDTFCHPVGKLLSMTNS